MLSHSRQDEEKLLKKVRRKIKNKVNGRTVSKQQYSVENAHGFGPVSLLTSWVQFLAGSSVSKGKCDSMGLVILAHRQ